MENISLPTGINTTALAGSAVSAQQDAQRSAPEVKKVAAPKEASNNDLTPRSQEEARFEAVKRAAQSLQQNPYPVSDTRFTIYKEITSGGDFVFTTRFTSLRDGEVTLVQEPELLARTGAGSGSLLEQLA